MKRSHAHLLEKCIAASWNRRGRVEEMMPVVTPEGTFSRGAPNKLRGSHCVFVIIDRLLRVFLLQQTLKMLSLYLCVF